MAMNTPLVVRGGWWTSILLEPVTPSLSTSGRQQGYAAYLWNLDAPKRPAIVFSGHQADIIRAEFSLDGTRIATASQDGSIYIWDRASRQTILRLGHEGVRRIAFTSSGQLVSAGTDGTVRWWWLDADPLREAVAGLDVSELTGAERERVSHLLGR